MSTPRRFAPTILLQDGTVLIAGGAGATDPLQALASAEIYDPVTGTFTPTGNMKVERRLTTGTLLNNGMVLIAGGININGTLDSAELYNPANKTFTFTGNLNGLRCYHTATLLNSGMVLIEGGEQPSGSTFVPLASAELYNPANGTFTVTGNLNAARVGPTATPLNNGTVLVTGGVEFSGETDVPQSSAEVYDPVAATFATTGSLNSARATQSATLLTNGTVLVTGGFDASGSLASAEFYEPGTLTPAGLTAITVSAAPPTTPATPTISPGTYQRFIATGTFASGNQQLHAVAWEFFGFRDGADQQRRNESGRSRGRGITCDGGAHHCDRYGRDRQRYSHAERASDGLCNWQHEGDATVLYRDGLEQRSGAGCGRRWIIRNFRACRIVQSRNRDIQRNRDAHYLALLRYRDAVAEWNGADRGRFFHESRPFQRGVV